MTDMQTSLPLLIVRPSIINSVMHFFAQPLTGEMKCPTSHTFSISSSQTLTPHKHQSPSSLLIIIMSQHLAWSFLNDMILSILSHDLFGSSILTLLALYRCLGPSAPNLAQTSPPRGPSLQSLDLPFSITTGPSSQALSWSSPLWSHNSMSCLICNELLDHTIIASTLSHFSSMAHVAHTNVFVWTNLLCIST